MILKVPYYSQYKDVENEEWRSKVCSVVCAKMIIDFLSLDSENNKENIEDLIEEGLEIGGYVEDYGWDHEAIVRLFRNRGINSYRQEFLSKDESFNDKLFKDGLDKIKNSLENSLPIIVSVKENFGNHKSTHSIVLIGYDEEKGAFIYHDSNSKIGKENEENLFVNLDKFKEYWRRFAIFVEK